MTTLRLKKEAKTLSKEIKKRRLCDRQYFRQRDERICHG